MWPSFQVYMLQLKDNLTAFLLCQLGSLLEVFHTNMKLKIEFIIQ